MQRVQISKYDSYKESGIDWLEVIPNQWHTNPGFVALEENQRSNTGLKEKQVLSLSYGSIVIKPEEKLTGLVPESFETYQIVEPGDIIVRGTDLQNDKTSLRTGLSRHRGIITSAYIGLRVKERFSSAFMHYFLHSIDTSKALYKFGTGLRQNLSFDDFKRMPIIDIPLEDQKAIAAFLDDKTVKIDKAVAIKERQIALLKERKQIIIQNAVTKGLNPDAPMKDSGVDWIGQIPAHWEVKRLKHLAAIRYGLGQPPRELETGLPIIRATNVERGKINASDLIRVDPEAVPKGRNAFMATGEIIVVRSGAYTGDSAIIPKAYEGAVAGYDMVVTAKSANAQFLASAFLAPYVLFEQLYLLRMRAAQPHLNKEELCETIVLVPPSKEQERIFAQLETDTQAIENAVAIKQRQISTLKEYKTTLINSAVTGKIKVV